MRRFPADCDRPRPWGAIAVRPEAKSPRTANSRLRRLYSPGLICFTPCNASSRCTLMDKYSASLIFSLDDISFPTRSTSQPFLRVMPTCTLHYYYTVITVSTYATPNVSCGMMNEICPPLKGNPSLLSSTSPLPPANARNSPIVTPVPPLSFSRKHRTIKNTNLLHPRAPSPTRCPRCGTRNTAPPRGGVTPSVSSAMLRGRGSNCALFRGR